MKPCLGGLAVGVACLMAVLTPLAYASPPDPTWIAGYWDDGDFDDVVSFLTGKVQAVPAIACVDQAVVGHAIPLDERTPDRLVSTVAGTFDPRAPPLSSTSGS